MKKIYYLVSFVAVAIAIASCDPLSQTYKALDAAPAAAKSLNYTLAATDYKLLPTTSTGYKSGIFASTADANTNIPTILNYKFFDYPNGSNIEVTYNNTTLALADSVFKDESYTLTAADYLLLPGNKYADFSVAQVLTWLPYKYPTPVANQLQVLTWTFYPTLAATAPQVYPGITLSTTGIVTTATGSFLYLNGAWIQAYQVTPAQYASVGLGQYNQFTSANDASIPSYLNNFLKNDPSVAGIATTGTIEYVSFNYYSSGKVTSQRIFPLTFNGTNWVTALTLNFVQSNGTWIPDPSIYYTLTTADTKVIAASTVGTAAERTNLGSYGDFSSWAAADLDAALILVLQTDFPNPKAGIPYKVTYLNYTGGKDVATVVSFTYSGTAWALSM